MPTTDLNAVEWVNLRRRVANRIEQERYRATVYADCIAESVLDLIEQDYRLVAKDSTDA